MLSTPLLEESHNGNAVASTLVRSLTQGLTPRLYSRSLSPAESCIVDAANLDSCISSVSQISLWAGWYSEYDHIRVISELDYVIDTIKGASSQWAGAATEARQISIVSKLETTLSASRGVPAQCLVMLAAEIEKVFPVATTQADIEWLADRYRSLMKTEFEGMKVQDWCLCKLLPHMPRGEQYKVTYEAKLKEFKAWFSKQNISIQEDFYAKYSACEQKYEQHGVEASNWQRKLPTMAECLRKGLGLMISAGHFECLDKLMFNFELRTLAEIKKKPALKWSAFGPALSDMMDECNLSQHTFHSTPWHRECLEKVGDVVLPQFQFKLYQLKGLLEAQIKTIDSLKAKVLAGMASAAIAGGQIAATYLRHMLEDQQS